MKMVTMVTMLTIQMRLNEELTVYFNPPLLNVKEIQLNELWTQFATYLIFCDIIDPSFSLTNFEDEKKSLKPSKLLGLFPRGETNIILPIHNKKELSNLTLAIKNTDMTTPTKDNVAILSLKIFHD